MFVMALCVSLSLPIIKMGRDEDPDMPKNATVQKPCFLFREKSLSMKSLAASCCYMLEMAMRKSKCIESRRRGSFCLKEMASFLVSGLYVLV